MLGQRERRRVQPPVLAAFQLQDEHLREEETEEREGERREGGGRRGKGEGRDSFMLPHTWQVPIPPRRHNVEPGLGNRTG